MLRLRLRFGNGLTGGGAYFRAMKIAKLLVCLSAGFLLTRCGQHHWNDCECELNGVWREAFTQDFEDVGALHLSTTLTIQDGVGDYYTLVDFEAQDFLDHIGSYTIEFLTCDSAVYTGLEAIAQDGNVIDTAILIDVSSPMNWQFLDDCNSLILHSRDQEFVDTLYAE